MKTTVLTIILALVLSFGASAQEKKTQNHNPIDGNLLFGRNDTSKYMNAKFPHGGAGTVRYMELTPGELFQSQFLFLHRGIIDPKSGLGEHVHRMMEEMYFVLDGSVARFTVNGRTSELPGPCMALCPMGGSHGIYNPSDKTAELMNIGISFADRKYDAVDLGKENDLVNTTLDSPPRFMWSVLDKRLLKEVPALYNGNGKMFYRRVWDSDSFRTNLGFVNHYLLPPGSSIGYHKHEVMEEVYYIFKGSGKATVDGKTVAVKAGDAVSVLLNGSHGLENDSNADLEVISLAVTLKKGVIDGIPFKAAK